MISLTNVDWMEFRYFLNSVHENMNVQCSVNTYVFCVENILPKKVIQVLFLFTKKFLHYFTAVLSFRGGTGTKSPVPVRFRFSVIRRGQNMKYRPWQGTFRVFPECPRKYGQNCRLQHFFAIFTSHMHAWKFSIQFKHFFKYPKKRRTLEINK